MKKFTTMLMAAFIAVAAMAAGPEKRGMQALNANAAVTSVAKQTTPKAKAVRVQVPTDNKVLKGVRSTMKKAPRKVEIADLLSAQWMLCSQYYAANEEGQLEPSIPAAGGTPISFEMSGLSTVSIKGFTPDATEAIEASFSMNVSEEMQAAGVVAEVTIAGGQTLLVNEKYGPIILANASSENQDDPIKAYVFQDGYIAFDGIWVSVIGGDGEYAGSQWGDYCLSTAMPVNATMTWGEGDEAQEIPVLVNQDPESPKNVLVYNFGGMETAINVTVKEDKSFVIDAQPMFYGGQDYGYLYVSGLLISGGQYYLETLTGVGTENTLTFNIDWMVYSPTSYAIYQIFDPATITLNAGEFVYPVIEDVAAVPATPEINAIGNYNKEYGYGYISFVVPTTDVDGNEIKEANLFYQFYSDIEGDIQPIVFTPEVCEKLTEDMTIIPYTFTDGWDFADKGTYKVVYINYNFNEMYDRIGVKSIYTGGGETHESEIAWAEVEKPEPVVLGGTFNFNEMDVPTSSNVSTDGDITEPLTLSEGNVTLVISEKTETATTPNRFWSTNAGPQLRMYSGTLTFTVPVGNAITAMTINYNKYNAGNTATPGTLTDDAENKVATWAPAEGAEPAQEVVITIAGNTQINSIDVEVEEAAVNYDLVVLPEGVEPEVWTIEGTFADDQSSDEIQRATEVAFDGNDIYVKGIPFYFEESWMKGTIDPETGIATFPTGQFVGEDEYGLEFMLGYDSASGAVCDIQFAYDADAKRLTQVTDFIIENGDSPSEVSAYGWWHDMVIYAGEPIVIDPVTAPEDLATETYLLKANEYIVDNEYDDDGNVISSSTRVEEYTYQTQVGFDGNDVYFKGFSDNTANMWAKGTLSEDGKTVTIPSGQYMGQLEILWYTFKYNITAVDEEGNMVDLVLNYDAENNTFTTAQTMVINEGSKSLNPYQTFADVVITKMQEFAATPADPAIAEFAPNANYPRVDFVILAKDVDGNDLIGTKLFYTIWVEKNGEEQQLTLSADQYEKLTEDMTEIPYTFDDSYDIYAGGTRVYLNQGEEEIASWTKIGIQSIYYGGGECNKSNIVWMETSTGIASLQEAAKAAVIYNIAGQRVEKAQKGLYIMNGKKVLVK